MICLIEDVNYYGALSNIVLCSFLESKVEEERKKVTLSDLDKIISNELIMDL